MTLWFSCCCLRSRSLLEHLSTLWTSSLLSSSSGPSLSVTFYPPQLFTAVFLALPCAETSKSQIHTHKHVVRHGFGDMCWWQWTALKRLQGWKTSQPVWESFFCFTPGKIYELSTQHLWSPAEMESFRKRKRQIDMGRVEQQEIKNGCMKSLM